MKCYVCDWEKDVEEIHQQDYGRGRLLIKCPRCGAYELAGLGNTIRAGSDPDLKLSAYIRDMNRITGMPVSINRGNIDLIRENIPAYSPTEKQRRLLLALSQLSKHPGHGLELFCHVEMVLAWAENLEEFNFYLQSLVDRGLLREMAGGIDERGFVEVVLTAKAWDAVDSQSDVARESSQAFVAMSFSPAMKHIYTDAIAPAIERAGYLPYRVDHDLHIDRIDAKIVSEIKNSRFLIADVTEQKAGVYYEAGFAQGLDIPVLWTVSSADLKNVHFDTRQYAHIVWDETCKFCEELGDLIEAIIGRGSRS